MWWPLPHVGTLAHYDALSTAISEEAIACPTVKLSVPLRMQKPAAN
jgi:hypothetical protein